MAGRYILAMEARIPVEERPVSVADRLKTVLDDIRYGRHPDVYEWNYFVGTGI